MNLTIIEGTKKSITKLNGNGVKTTVKHKVRKSVV